MKRQMQELVTFQGAKLLGSTGRAVKVDLGDGRVEWFPRSQVCSMVGSMDPAKRYITVTAFIAKQKGLR